MNCDGVKALLSEGQDLTESAEHHLASCAGCRALVEALTPAEAILDKEQIGRFQGLITTSLRPVRPLPSDRKLALGLLSLFTAFSLLAAVPFGYNGFHVLNARQRLAYYTLILLCATWFSIAIVQEMIPGSKRKINPRWMIITATLSLVLLISALFHNFALARFVQLGIPCLRLGCICALFMGALSWFVCRRGFFSSPLAASVVVGFFAGLAGMAVLALHCPIENSAHIVVWHLGAMMLGGLGGAALGTLRR